MPLDTWEDFQKEIERMNGDAEYRRLRPLIEPIEAIVGARVNMDVARDLLSAVESVRSGKLEPSTVLEQADNVSSGRPGFAQNDWKVNTVNQLVVGGVTQLRAAEVTIPVPIVLVVMNAAEAKALASYEAFTEQSEALRKDFEALEADLKANKLDDWTSQYGLRSEDWCPSGSAETVEARATAALIEFTETLGLEKRLIPKFIDVRKLQKSRAHILQLRKAGCIVVLDTISLRHPGLLAAFQHTLLDAYPATAVVRLSPLPTLQEMTRNLIYSMQLAMSDSELSKRLVDPGEYDVCTEVSEINRFPPWLQARVKQICSKAIAESGIRSDMNA
jgi:hypothetical protein